MPKYLDLEGLKLYDKKLKEYINWDSAYQKPEDGIPFEDLEASVQQSLGKADTALQSSDIANSLSESDDSPVSASAVYTAIVDEEEVISAALNDLNSRIENMVVEETDPTVPSWAKQATKPSYTASEIGAVSDSITVNGKSLSSDITLTATDVNAVPTSRSINGKSLSSNITLTAADVNALPASTTIPSKLSDLTNDAGFITSSDLADEVSQEDKPVTANAVYEYITEDEKVIASALNDLNERIGDVETTVSDNEVVTAAALNDLNSNKQNKLVSGTNIKTINNQSLLGEGNITISGGGSGDGGDGSNITEITEQNVEEAVNATAFIVVKIGIDPYLKEEINENEYGEGLAFYNALPPRYYLFYAVINNNVVSLPINLLHHFIIKGKPVIGTKNYYKIANYRNNEDKNWNKVISLVNVNEKTFTVDEGNDKFSDAVYVNSEIIPLGIELSNFPKFNNGNFIESDIYNYRLVSNDFERKLKTIRYEDQTPYIDSEYIRSERFNNGLVGINNGITKSLLNINNNFISIGNISYTNYKGIDFTNNNYTDGNLTNYFDFTTRGGQLKGYNIRGDYTLSAQFDLRLYSNVNLFYNFDNWAITKDNIAGFINMMVTNKIEEDLGYGACEFYNFQLIYKHINTYDTNTYGYHIINNGNLLNITNSQGGYYFILCGNTVDPSDSIYELVFVNIENETFANGELLFRPILIMWKKQENS